MENGINWKQFFISVLGTAIGVGLTFFFNGIKENNKKERTQRLTAIMVIHDIDNTIDVLKYLKEEEEDSDRLTQSVLKRQDDLSTVPDDTLIQLFNNLVNFDYIFRFDTSKEKIFNSDLDTWQNLGCPKFIDNVQTFYYDRQALQEILNQQDFFREPISNAEYMDIIQQSGWVTQKEFADRVRPFLKEKFADRHVAYYIDISSERIRRLNMYIDSWTRLNDENKFLMGLTDKELEDYINSITDNGVAVKPAQLAGTWVNSMEDENSSQYDFHRDHTLDFLLSHSQLIHILIGDGRLKYTISTKGTWSLQADSLFINLDFTDADFQIDMSEIVPKEDKRDSLEGWGNRYKDYLKKTYTETDEGILHRSYKARLDTSHDKMEWTANDNAWSLKRKEQ